MESQVFICILMQKSTSRCGKDLHFFASLNTCLGKEEENHIMPSPELEPGTRGYIIPIGGAEDKIQDRASIRGYLNAFKC
mgnify:CR=1 FL=1